MACDRVDGAFLGRFSFQVLSPGLHTLQEVAKPNAADSPWNIMECFPGLHNPVHDVKVEVDPTTPTGRTNLCHLIHTACTIYINVVRTMSCV